MQRQVRFNRVPEKVPRRRSGRLWCRARLGSTGVGEGSGEGSAEKVWEALVQSEVKFDRGPEKAPEKVPEKVLGIFGAGPGQVQQVPEKVSQKAPEKFAFLLFVFMHVHTAYMDVIRAIVLF